MSLFSRLIATAVAVETIPALQITADEAASQKGIVDGQEARVRYHVLCKPHGVRAFWTNPAHVKMLLNTVYLPLLFGADERAVSDFARYIQYNHSIKINVFVSNADCSICFERIRICNRRHQNISFV